MYKGLHVTHNDADGVACAIVSNYLLKEIWWNNIYVENISDYAQDGIVRDYLKQWKEDGTFETQIPDVIFISDLSVHKDVWYDLCEFCFEHNVLLAGFDHHPSNDLLTDVDSSKTKGYHWYNIPGEIEPEFGVVVRNPNYKECSQKVSAAYILYSVLLNDDKLLVPDGLKDYAKYRRIMNTINRDMNWQDRELKPFSNFVRNVSRYDTWTWTDPAKKHFSFDGEFEDKWQTLNGFYSPQIFFDKMMRYFQLDTTSTDYAMLDHEFGSIYTTIKEKNKNSIISDQWKTHTVVCNVSIKDRFYRAAVGFYSKGKANLIAHHILDNVEENMLDCVIVLYPNYGSISFYSKGSMMDVGSICKSLGGGGHFNAAGTKVEPTIMLTMLALWYDREKQKLDLASVLENRELVSDIVHHYDVLPCIEI